MLKARRRECKQFGVVAVEFDDLICRGFKCLFYGYSERVRHKNMQTYLYLYNNILNVMRI